MIPYARPGAAGAFSAPLIGAGGPPSALSAVPLTLSLDASAAGSLTGGNAANTLRVEVCYYLIDVPA